MLYSLDEAFDSTRRNYIWKRMKQRRVETKIIGIIKVPYKNNKNKIRMHNQESTEFEIKTGLSGVIIKPTTILHSYR